MKTLIYAFKGLFRKPNIMRKFAVFIAVTAVLFILCAIFSRIVENAILMYFVRWLWLPLALLYLILRHGEPFKRRSYYRFFEQIDLLGYDKILPEYLWEVPHNEYITKIRFQSRVPFTEWEKVIPKIEMYHNQKIYKIENLEEDLTMLDVYLIVEKLPKFITWSDDLMVEGRRFVIGESYRGQEIFDLTETPHGLIAGASGGGKTTILRCIIRQAILKRFNVSILDFKNGGDFSGFEDEYKKYNDLGSDCASLIISEPEKARDLLMALCVEVRGRLDMFNKAGVANIDEYNQLYGDSAMRPWLLCVDEAAEILEVKPKDKSDKEMYAEIDKCLRTLARTARAAGVHIIMGLIRPDSNVIDGQIKNNLLWRACGYFADPAASRIVLDNDKATELPKDIKGRFIIGEEETQAYYLPMPKTTPES